MYTFCISLIEIAHHRTYIVKWIYCCLCYCTWKVSEHLWGSKELSPKEESMQKELGLKFIYSEKAIKFCEISTNYLSYVLPVKYLVEISQNFVAFSEYMNFIQKRAILLNFVVFSEYPNFTIFVSQQHQCHLCSKQYRFILWIWHPSEHTLHWL